MDYGVYAPAVVFIEVFKRQGVEITMEEARAPMGAHKKVRIQEITEAPAGRPFPFACWKNAIELQVCPVEARLKIGDTVPDIGEGLNAGMWVIGLAPTGAHYVVDGIWDVPPVIDEINRRLACGEKP